MKETQAVPGVFAASRPLQVVQVDHTKADIFVVDEETRQPIGRPWLTLAMDVCSRMVTGNGSSRAAMQWIRKDTARALMQMRRNQLVFGVATSAALRSAR
ncbi:hypothetical protein [Sinorhizobium meliloti]|uniref:hypothetical protein n=1 Tax=Rhizobium meliloti TaxID=382 RepID=UPI003F5CC430